MLWYLMSVPQRHDNKTRKNRLPERRTMNKAELKIEMLRHNDTGEDLAKALGITRQTLSRKMNENNADFTQGEISVIRARYDLTGERIEQIFFAD